MPQRQGRAPQRAMRLEVRQHERAAGTGQVLGHCPGEVAPIEIVKPGERQPLEGAREAFIRKARTRRWHRSAMKERFVEARGAREPVELRRGGSFLAARDEDALARERDRVCEQASKRNAS